MKKLLFFYLIMVFPVIMFAQQTLTGTVTDEYGTTLPGVNVSVKGTFVGTATNIDGNFTIPATVGDIIVFQFIGYRTIEIEYTGTPTINVAMETDVIGLDEVVVVGYGTQKRINLTGSVTIVDSKELEGTAVSTVSQSLMGRAPGVFILHHSGQPGATQTSINIRGFGTPLFIVDGVEVSQSYMDNLQPNDIESFNVLKDASAAAVYGARAGNGVILITTKRGKVSAPEFTYNGNYSQQYFTVIPGGDRVSSDGYASMYNVFNQLADEHIGRPPVWSLEDIQKFRDGSDPINYPNTDWWRLTLKDRTPLHQHNLSVRGGTENVKYYIGLGYMNEKGIYRSDDINHDRFSLRSNIDIALTPRLDVGIDLSLTNQDYIGPFREMPGGVMMRIWRARPFAPNYVHPDPEYLPAMLGGLTQSPILLSSIDAVGFRKWNKLFGFTRLNAEYELPYGFKTRVLINLNRTYHRDRQRRLEGKEYTRNEETGEYTHVRSLASFDFLQESNSIDYNINPQFFLTWDRNINNHQLNALFVYERNYKHSDYVMGYRRNYELPLDYLFAGPDANKHNDGYASEYGRESYITRLNYNLSDRYLFEFTGRWDGSALFPPESRWGFFPSASLGWIISNEEFMRDLIPVISNLKIRASHGKLGYDAAGAFQYLSTYTLLSRYLYGNDLAPGIRADALPNINITWEKMTTSNIGLDFSLFRESLLEGSIDYFYRLQTDVLGRRILVLPDVIGATLPQENIDEYDNRGWELYLVHRNNIGDLNFKIGGNVSTNREKNVYRDQPEYATMEAYRRGNTIGEWTDRFWAYPTDGLFKTQEEIDSWADIDGQGNRNVKIGDIRYVDYNGDGRITPEDMIVAGRGTMPKLMFGIDLSMSWKGFDFSILWQGAANYSHNLRASHRQLITPFRFSNSPTMYMYENMYTPENPWMPANTENPKWPRYGTHTDHNFNRNAQIWLQNMAYIRLKNLQLGYSIPKNYINTLGINNLRVYFSGYNLLTFGKYTDILDPELPHTANAEHYPQMSNINFGVQMNF